MANMNQNLLVRGAKGKVSDQFVFRTRGNTTSIAKMPVQKKGRVATSGQIEKRDRFTCASLYAQGILANEKLRKKYEKNATANMTWHNLAFRDYLTPPVVKKIITAEYNGAAGSKITVKAKDDFRVMKVKVKVFAADGTLLEEGDAYMDSLYRKNWVYTTKQNNKVVRGSKIVATAYDLPENKGEGEIVCE